MKLFKRLLLVGLLLLFVVAPILIQLITILIVDKEAFHTTILSLAGVGLIHIAIFLGLLFVIVLFFGKNRRLRFSLLGLIGAICAGIFISGRFANRQ
jgi:uncharacterized BrkB/YihY/UPF0761 family membrane protein